MTDGPMDRSDPSEKASYRRTFIYRWRNDVILLYREHNYNLERTGLASMTNVRWPMDRSDPLEKPSYGRTIILPMVKRL